MTAADPCIFCAITHGQAEASVVYRDEFVMAFLDLRQFHPGHTLVIPRAHIQDIYGLDDASLAGSLLSAVALVARLLERALAPAGMSVWQSTGAAAGQEVPHLHMHVLPRYTDDGFLRVYPSTPGYPPRAELDALAARLRES